MNDLVKRIRQVVRTWLENDDDHETRAMRAQALNWIGDLEVDVERLREALAPFAAAAEHMTVGKRWDPKELRIWSDETSGCRVTVADFQQAAEAGK